ncbi:MAG: hypothetical protein MZV65_39490 [Chromatiales bacterium]|nr:hypothetical protein [Chromatiales bacterium]MCK7581120.1 hypothetical protein [Chromatiales bacterium]
MSIGSFAGGLAGGLKTGAYLRTLQDERKTNELDRELKQDQLRERREASEIIKNLQRDLLGTSAVDAGASNPVRSGVTVAPRDGSAPAPSTSAPTSASGGTGATDSGIVTSLLRTESGGDYQAKNDAVGAGGQRGHYGRLQFGHARLADASRALGEEITPERFLNDPALQQRVEAWHLQDIDAFVKEQGLDRYIGQEINGTPLTQDSLRAVAHLGGKDGLRRYLESGGRHNPKDANGTYLSDYARTHAGAGLTGVNTNPVPTLSAEQYADIYQRYTLLAASNPTAAERLKPTLESVRNLGLSRYMEQYQGDRGSLDYMRYYGQGQALFGQPMDPTLLFNAERMTKADERAERSEQRAERSEQRAERADRRAEEMQQWTMDRTTQADLRAEETHKATMDEHELNRRLKEAEVTLKQYEPLYKLIRGDQFEAAQRLANGMGFKISGFEDGTVKLPDGTEVPTTYYWRTTEDGQQVRENTAEQARRLGFVEANLDRLKVQTVKSNEYNKPDKLVGVTVGADGQPVAREIQVQPVAGSDRETVAAGIGAAGIGAAEIPAPKASAGNWFTRMFRSDEPDAAPATERGQAPQAEPKPETAEPVEATPQAAVIEGAPTFADSELGVMQEQDGKEVLVYPNGMEFLAGGRVTHKVINGEVVPMRQDVEGP